MSHPPTRSRLHHLWPAPLLVLLVGLAYWPGRGGGYVFDDFPNIVDNMVLHVTTMDWHAWIAAMFSSEAGTLQRPLAMLSFAINYYFTGLDPMPMKLTNIAIHALNALLVLGLVRLLMSLALPDAAPRRREWAARFTAAAWALHPINLMAVLFVVQRMESLSHTFVFAGLWLYLLGRQRQLVGKNGWSLIGLGVLGGTALGALSKESAVLLPLYAACIELCLFAFSNAQGRRDRRLLVGYLLVLVIPALLAAAWLLRASLSPGAYATRNFDLGERLLTEGRVVMDYLHWTLFPSLRQLSLYHDDYPVSHSLLIPWTTLPALLGIAALLVLAAWAATPAPTGRTGPAVVCRRAAADRYLHPAGAGVRAPQLLRVAGHLPGRGRSVAARPGTRRGTSHRPPAGSAVAGRTSPDYQPARTRVERSATFCHQRSSQAPAIAARDLLPCPLAGARHRLQGRLAPAGYSRSRPRARPRRTQQRHPAAQRLADPGRQDRPAAEGHLVEPDASAVA